MGLYQFRKKIWNSSNKTSKENTPPKGISAREEKIPRMVINRLNNVNEGMALAGVRALRANTKYPTNDVCEHLILILQRDGREEVVREASEALAEVLERVYLEETAVLMIKRGLFAKKESNANTFIKILENTGIKHEIKKCAIEMLAKFSEKDVAPETIDMVETALFERCMDPQERDEIKNLVKYRFGPSRDGRPKILLEEIHGEDTATPDETLVIESEGECRITSGPGRAGDSADEINANETPTRGMDILAGWIGLL
jgi:hypothetical protein